MLRHTHAAVALSVAFAIPAQAAQSIHVPPGEAPSLLRFTDVAASTGCDLPTLGRGAAMVDFDGDGLLDLAFANAGQPNAFLRQRTNGTFELMNSAWGIGTTDLRLSWGLAVADFDNDGDDDVFVANGGWIGKERDQLLRNDLNVGGGFTDVSDVSGALCLPVEKTFGVTALDYDRDGWLDLFVTHMATIGQPRPTCRLYRNENGQFWEDVSEKAGIVHEGAYLHCSAGDLDNDGWIDIGVGAWTTGNLFYHNNGDGTFSEVAEKLGLRQPIETFGTVLEDFDNDGWMDVYLPFYQFAGGTPSKLFRNDQTGRLIDVTQGSGMSRNTDMGHNTGDVDGDGFPDIFIGTGSPSMADDDVLLLVRPNGNGGFTARDVARTSGLLDWGPTRQHGIALGDFDRDGDIDVYNNNGGPSWLPNTISKNTLWRNDGPAQNWIAADLVGVLSNRSAVGARSFVRTDSGREVHRFLSAGKGFANTDSPTQHFGLGSERAVEELVVRWPSGIEQTLLSPALGETHEIVETGLVAAKAPGVDRRWTIDACGPADHVVEVLASESEIHVPRPRFGGVLRLGLPIRRLGSAVLNAQGHGVFETRVPDKAGLQGRTFYVQAWIHEDGATSGGTLTNLLRVRVE